MPRLTLSQFLALPPSLRCLVTHIDIDRKFEARLDRVASSLGENEEYPGEASDRKVDQRGFNKP